MDAYAYLHEKRSVFPIGIIRADKECHPSNIPTDGLCRKKFVIFNFFFTRKVLNLKQTQLLNKQIE